jgi:hypothetical protein
MGGADIIAYVGDRPRFSGPVPALAANSRVGAYVDTNIYATREIS